MIINLVLGWSLVPWNTSISTITYSYIHDIRPTMVRQSFVSWIDFISKLDSWYWPFHEDKVSSLGEILSTQAYPFISDIRPTMDFISTLVYPCIHCIRPAIGIKFFSWDWYLIKIRLLLSQKLGQLWGSSFETWILLQHYPIPV